jgi:hypothetical protein
MLNKVTDGPIGDFRTFRTDLHPKKSKARRIVSMPVGPLGQGAGLCDFTGGLTITDRQKNERTYGRRAQKGLLSLKFVNNAKKPARTAQ